MSRGPTGGKPAKVKVENLHPGLAQADLQDLFERIGPIISLHLLYDLEDEPTGIAIVTFVKRTDAEKAVAEYDGQLALGQSIKLRLLGSETSRAPRELFSSASSQKASAELLEVKVEGSDEAAATDGDARSTPVMTPEASEADASDLSTGSQTQPATPGSFPQDDVSGNYTGGPQITSRPQLSDLSAAVGEALRGVRAALGEAAQAVSTQTTVRPPTIPAPRMFTNGGTPTQGRPNYDCSNCSTCVNCHDCSGCKSRYMFACPLRSILTRRSRRS